MTHLLPLSKSGWHWSHLDESFSILRQGVPSHTHSTVSAPFPFPTDTRSPHTKGSPHFTEIQQHPHSSPFPTIQGQASPGAPLSSWLSLCPWCNREGCHPLHPTPQVSIPPCAGSSLLSSAWRRPLGAQPYLSTSHFPHMSRVCQFSSGVIIPQGCALMKVHPFKG